MIPLFLDISGGEFLLIFLAIFIVFGPKRVPEIARQIGKTMNELKKTTSDLSREFKEGADQVKREVQHTKSSIMVDADPMQTGINEIKDSIEKEASQIANSVRRPFGTGLGDDIGPGEVIQPKTPEIESPKQTHPQNTLTDHNPAAN